MTTVLIAGANRGLGLEFVKQYAADGATVIAGCRDPDAASDLKALADQGDGKITIHALDVGDDGSVAAFKSAVGDTPIDIFVANAGVYGGQQQSFGEVDFEGWLKTLNVNTLGPVRLAQAFADNVAAAKGKLIAITSQMGSTAESSGGYFAYRSSKAGLNMAFKGVALQLKDRGVVTAVFHPGWVQTDMGGKAAPLTPPDSISGMRKVIAGLTDADNGGFRDYSGKVLPW